jgi:hypothetical protein
MLANVFEHGEVKFKAGAIVELPQHDADKAIRRGWATQAEAAAPPEAPAAPAGKKKGR